MTEEAQSEFKGDEMVIDCMTPFSELPHLLTVHEFCALTRQGRNTAYNWLHQNQIRSVRFGRKIFIPREAIQNYISASNRGDVEKATETGR